MARSLLSSILRLCALALARRPRRRRARATDGEELQFDVRVPDRSTAQTNMMRAQAPRITQGDLTIVADDALATGVEFDEAGECRLTGNVRMEVETAVMEADSAVFTFARNGNSRAASSKARRRRSATRTQRRREASRDAPARCRTTTSRARCA